MNWDQMEGKWKQFQGSVKQKWGKLTDDDLTFIGGSRDRLVGKLQERYGMKKEEAENRATEWIDSVPPAPQEAHSRR
jgi:uncharacterized protein YjbJ (UPF0337 family)